MRNVLVIVFSLSISVLGRSQGLENILVETYYVSDSNDATDTDGGSLEVGSVTYRVFVDMAPGYELQAVYGNENHPLSISTSTYFFNNEDRGESKGDVINDIRLDENTVALDSWLTIGAASDAHIAVPKNIDSNGSIVGGINNDGGSEGIAGGLLTNLVGVGIPLTQSDGLLSETLPSSVVTLGVDLSLFANANAGTTFSTSSGAWSVLEGFQGVTSENYVLIAQLTTKGSLTFHINLQLGTPGGGTEKYVYSNPIAGEIGFPALNFPVVAVNGCTSSAACNYNPLATTDDGSCLLPVVDCSTCVGDQLVVIDTDMDGVCNAQEILGCTSDTACNYNVDATEDDFSCVESTPGCSFCNSSNDGLILIDSDGDGVCDANEISGCLNPEACNYNPNTTNEIPCIIPFPNCVECNVLGTGLILVDTDGDGICDAEDTPPTCLGDFDANGTIASADLLFFISQYGCQSECTGDLNNDGVVDTSDILIMFSLYGADCQ
ncbi:MAG: hypothetical protein GC193_02495 [Cryomorphaceae bacterium]|nr:hypothetical protein [Cryomorphaceae bacterium]